MYWLLNMDREDVGCLVELVRASLDQLLFTTSVSDSLYPFFYLTVFTLYSIHLIPTNPETSPNFLSLFRYIMKVRLCAFHRKRPLSFSFVIRKVVFLHKSEVQRNINELSDGCIWSSADSP